METGIFVKDLVLEEVPIHDPKNFVYENAHFPDNFMATAGPKIAGPFKEQMVKRHFVPWSRICHSGRPDVYVAYSKKVEEILGINMQLLYARLKRAENDATHATYTCARLNAEISTVRGAGFWKRFLFLFGKQI